MLMCRIDKERYRTLRVRVDVRNILDLFDNATKVLSGALSGEIIQVGL